MFRLCTKRLTHLLYMFPERATIDAITIVEFQLSSASVVHANIFFGSKTATALSILNSQDNGNSAIRAEVPGFSLHEASSCVPPAPSCSSLVNVTISVMLNDYAVAMFFRPFELLLPEQPQVDAIGSLVVDINNPTTLNFSVSHPKYIDKVLIGNISCPFVISPRSSMPIASVHIAASMFSLSSPNTIVIRSRVDPDYFSVTAGFRVDFAMCHSRLNQRMRADPTLSFPIRPRRLAYRLCHLLRFQSLEVELCSFKQATYKLCRSLAVWNVFLDRRTHLPKFLM